MTFVKTVYKMDFRPGARPYSGIKKPEQLYIEIEKEVLPFATPRKTVLRRGSPLLSQLMSD